MYAVAEVLRERGVPFMFATGYDEKAIRLDFAWVPHMLKPYELATVGQMLFDAALQAAA